MIYLKRIERKSIIAQGVKRIFTIQILIQWSISCFKCDPTAGKCLLPFDNSTTMLFQRFIPLIADEIYKLQNEKL